MRHDDLPGVSRRHLDARGLRMHTAEREPALLGCCGHWAQQERPDDVSKAMIGFIRELD